MPIPGRVLAKGSIPIDRIEKGTIKIVHRIHFLEGYLTFAIDSTGTKIFTAQHTLEDEDVDNLTEAHFEISVTNIAVTDAAIRVVLRNNTDATDVDYIPTTIDVWRMRKELNIDTVKGLAGKNISVEVRVTTASATAGAKAVFRGARLILVRKFP